MPRLETKLAALLLVGLLSLAAVVMIGYVSVHRLADSLRLSQHTDEVLAAINSVHADLAEVSTGSRGYLISGRPQYLEPYEKAVAALPSAVDELARLISDNAAQVQRVERLQPLVTQRIAAAAALIDLRRAAFTPAEADALLDADKAVMDRLRDVMTELRGEEIRLRSARSASAAASERFTRWVLIIGSVLGLALATLGSVSLWRELGHRRQREQQLKRLGDAAETANRAKSEFLANMSHEIRTPMTAILGYADLLVDPEQNQSERLNAANVIRRNGAHLLNIINDILDLSKIEAGEMEVIKQPCSPCRVLYDVASTMRARAAEKRLEFDVHTEGPVPAWIETDPTRLQQIVANLVNNAVKFTVVGSVRLVMRMDAGAAEPTLLFQVTDTGVGIAAADIQRLFEPFVQVDTSAARRAGGTGLGLAISRRLARKLGGDVTVTSEVARGSVFTFRLPVGPLDKLEMVERCRESLVDEPARETGLRLHGRVLLAEDGVDNRALLSQYLRHAGAEVIVAENGVIAVEIATEALHGSIPPIDVVLMDMQMPQLDGYAATTKLRQRGFNKPVIALTAHAMAEHRDRALRAGCTDYLSKPVRRQVLLETVARHLPPPPPSIEERTLRPTETEAFTRPFVADFVANLPRQVRRLRETAANGNREELTHVLHDLKGAGGMYGFMVITRLAARIHNQAMGPADDAEVAREVQKLIDLLRSVEGYDADGENRDN